MSRAVTAFDELAERFASHGAEPYGEAVSQAEHALQCATLVERAGCSTAFVVAAPLHDIGHPTKTRRRSTRRTCATRNSAHALRELFPESVWQPVRLHVSAKRFLCAVDSSYHAACRRPPGTAWCCKAGRSTSVLPRLISYALCPGRPDPAPPRRPGCVTRPCALRTDGTSSCCWNACCGLIRSRTSAPDRLIWLAVDSGARRRSTADLYVEGNTMPKESLLRELSALREQQQQPPLNEEQRAELELLIRDIELETGQRGRPSTKAAWSMGSTSPSSASRSATRFSPARSAHRAEPGQHGYLNDLPEVKSPGMAGAFRIRVLREAYWRTRRVVWCDLRQAAVGIDIQAATAYVARVDAERLRCSRRCRSRKMRSTHCSWKSWCWRKETR